MTDDVTFTLTADTSKFDRALSRAVRKSEVDGKRMRNALDVDVSGRAQRMLAQLETVPTRLAQAKSDPTDLLLPPEDPARKVVRGAGKAVKAIPAIGTLQQLLGKDPLVGGVTARNFEPNDAVDAFLFLESDIEQRIKTLGDLKPGPEKVQRALIARELEAAGNLADRLITAADQLSKTVSSTLPGGPAGDPEFVKIAQESLEKFLDPLRRLLDEASDRSVARDIITADIPELRQDVIPAKIEFLLEDIEKASAEIDEAKRVLADAQNNPSLRGPAGDRGPAQANPLELELRDLERRRAELEAELNRLFQSLDRVKTENRALLQDGGGGPVALADTQSGGFRGAVVGSGTSVSAFALPAEPIDPALVQRFADFGGQASVAAGEWEIFRGEVDRTAEAGREAGRLLSGALRSMVFDGLRARASAARRVGPGCGGARPWAGAHAFLVEAV